MLDRIDREIEAAWREWHADTGLSGNDIPRVNPSFNRGYRAAVAHLLPLLAASWAQSFAPGQAAAIRDLLGDYNRVL